MTNNLSKRLAAEFFGSAFLLAAVVGSGIMGVKLADGSAAIALLANSISTGAALAVLITVFGPVSGAHFNPAVSAAMLIREGFPPFDAAAYALAQVAGAFAGVMIAHAMFDLPLVQVSQTVRTGTGQWIAEAVATAGLVLTIIGVSRTNPSAVAIMVALYITSAYWFTASTSFANPAVTLARSITATFAGISPGSVAAFIGAQIVGMVAALGVAHLVFSEAPSGEVLSAPPRRQGAP